MIRVTGDIGADPVRRTLEFSGCAAGFYVPFVSRSGAPLVLRPGAFAPTFADSSLRRRIRILHDHDPARVIGRPLELREDERGLFVRASLDYSARTIDVIRQMLCGELTQLSIGFTYTETTSGRLGDLVLREVSIVRAGANPLARIDSAIVSPYTPRLPRATPSHWRVLPDEERGERCTPSTT